MTQAKARYSRILVKLSGEALLGDGDGDPVMPVPDEVCGDGLGHLWPDLRGHLARGEPPGWNVDPRLAHGAGVDPHEQPSLPFSRTGIEVRERRFEIPVSEEDGVTPRC